MDFKLKDIDPDPCEGSVHVIPVPPGYTPESAWEEITKCGELQNPTWNEDEVNWAVMECPGFENCECQEHYVSEDFQILDGEDHIIYDHLTTLLAFTSEPDIQC